MTTSQLMLVVAQTLWYFLPALIANMAPVFATFFNWLPALNRPLDGGVSFQGESLLGANKTIRGLLFGLFFGSITALIQYWLQPLPMLQPLPLPTTLYAFGWGALLGFGALLGDALKSFCKRRLHITSGSSWKPWDQIDVIVGVLLVTWWVKPLPVPHIIAAFVVIGVGMLLTSYIGTITKIKKTI